MNYNLKFKHSATKSLKKIPITDRERIMKRILELRADPLPVSSIKLSNEGAYRIRQGNYRIIYTVVHDVLQIEIIRIGHRRNIYE